MQGNVIPPDGDHQRDLRRRDNRQHSLEGDAQGMDKVRLDFGNQDSETLLVTRQAERSEHVAQRAQEIAETPG